MKARLIGSNTIVEVNECGYQDMGGKYYGCPAHKCYYHEDRLDFNIDEDKPISVSPSLKNAAWDYSRSQPFNKPARFRDFIAGAKHLLKSPLIERCNEAERKMIMDIYQNAKRGNGISNPIIKARNWERVATLELVFGIETFKQYYK